MIGSDIKYPSKEKIVELGNVFSQYCFLMQIREQNKTLIGLKKENAKLKDLSHMAQILEARKDKYLRDQQKLLALKTKEAVKARQEVEGSKLKLEQAHLELQELDREKSRFFQNISHEFRTPLTLIINSVENLLNLKGEPDPQLLRVAYNNSLRMLRLVNQLLDFQKLSLGKSKVELTPQNMFSFFRIVEDYFFSAANHQKVTLKPLVNGIPLSESEKEDSVWVLGNRDSLEKIVFNYLSNAIKFSPKNSEVILSLNFNEDSVTLSVKDQGPGISQEDQGKLFKVFSQVGNQGYSSSDGSGVGLALAKELTHIMGGSVSLESEEGEGAIFSSTFPRAKGDFESPSEEDTQKVQKSWYLAEHLDSNEKESPEEYEVELDTEDYSSGAVILGEKGKVLVVDDLKDMRIIIKRLLIAGDF